MGPRVCGRLTEYPPRQLLDSAKNSRGARREGESADLFVEGSRRRT